MKIIHLEKDDRIEAVVPHAISQSGLDYQMATVYIYNRRDRTYRTVTLDGFGDKKELFEIGAVVHQALFDSLKTYREGFDDVYELQVRPSRDDMC